MTTTRLGLPLITGNMSVDVVRDFNALSQDIDLKVASKQSVEGASTELTSHKAEDAIHLASGTANAITVSTNANYTYSQFKQLHVKAVANNTGNLTINVDGLGAKPALKFDGTQLAAGAIKAGKIYDWYYDIANGGRFFLIAKASGTAVVEDVLAGKPFSNDDGEFVGTMPNRGVGGTVSPSTVNQIKQSGYYSSDITVLGDADLIASNILTGKNIFGVAGSLQPKTVVSWSTPGANLNQGQSQTSYLSLGKALPTPHLLIAKSYGSMFNGSSMYANGNTEQSASSDRYPVRIGFDTSKNEIWVNISNNSGSLTNGVYATVYGIY